MLKKLVLLIFILGIFVPLTHAEIIHLGDGKTIKGKIISRDSSRVKIDVDGVYQTIYLSQIERIEEDTPGETGRTKLRPIEEIPAYRKELILRLVNANGARQGLNNILLQLLSTAPIEKRSEYRNAFKLDEMVNMIIPVYDKYYTDEELEQLIKFYISPAGRKAIAVTPALMQDTMNISLQYFKSRLPVQMDY